MMSFANLPFLMFRDAVILNVGDEDVVDNYCGPLLPTQKPTTTFAAPQKKNEEQE